MFLKIEADSQDPPVIPHHAAKKERMEQRNKKVSKNRSEQNTESLTWWSLLHPHHLTKRSKGI